ncbi:hypothetical protein [Desulfosporosinus fructosivorans]
MMNFRRSLPQKSNKTIALAAGILTAIANSDTIVERNILEISILIAPEYPPNNSPRALRENVSGTRCGQGHIPVKLQTINISMGNKTMK